MKSCQPALALIGVLSITRPAFSQAPAASTPSFEVASIKRSAAGVRTQIAMRPGGGFVANGVRLNLLIAAAYRVLDYQIIGTPDWVSKDQWSIAAKAPEGTIDPPSRKPAFLNVTDMMAARLRALLEDRYALKTHRERREMQVYALSMSKGGSQLKAVEPPPERDQGTAPQAAAPQLARADETTPGRAMPPAGTVLAGRGTILASAASMDQIVILLGRLLDRPLIDKTGLPGYFDMRLQFDPATAPRMAPGATPANTSPPPVPAASDPAGPSLFAAVNEQLGLKLELRKEPVEVLVVDSVQKATEN